MEQSLTVSDVNRLLGTILEESFPRLVFEAEIAELTIAGSGHCYMTLKDSQSQLSAVIWSMTARGLGFRPQIGLAVVCHGKPNVYQKNGRLQIVVSKMELAGEGLLRKKFLELKAKLEKEGLFDSSRKRPLPLLPAAVGVVTSAQGAVIHDIMVRVRERMPSQKVYLIDSRVQGPGAAEEVAAALAEFNRLACVDVIIVARGGGSLEDLWAFNEEIVVRAIFASRIPVVSGVGHEVDVTLADYAADVRAPTPTAAAEIVVPKRSDLLSQIGEWERRLCDTERWFAPLGQQVDELSLRLIRASTNRIAEARLQLSHAEAHLKLLDPQRVLTGLGERITQLHGTLRAGLSRAILRALSEVQSRTARLERASPARHIALARGRVSAADQRLGAGVKLLLQRRKAHLDTIAARLESTSPQRVLERGYSFVERDGVVVRSVSALKVSDRVQIRMADGKVGATVTE